MSENLTDEERAEIWAIACRKGIDTGRARIIWEEEKKLFAPKPVEEPEPESDPFEGEESEQEYRDLRLENEKRKSKLLDEIEDSLDKESVEEAKTVGQDDLVNSFFDNVTSETKESFLWFLDKIAQLNGKKKDKALIIRVIQKGEVYDCVAQYVKSEGLPKSDELVDE